MSQTRKLRLRGLRYVQNHAPANGVPFTVRSRAKGDGVTHDLVSQWGSVKLGEWAGWDGTNGGGGRCERHLQGGPSLATVSAWPANPVPLG